tara:strand:- start:896 stop:1072 length:177 start_codon:yes stop_codon:yes gene_type:complete
MADGKFQSYEYKACHSGVTQDVLISVRHIAEMMTLNGLKEVSLVMPMGDKDATINIKR